MNKQEELKGVNESIDLCVQQINRLQLRLDGWEKTLKNLIDSKNAIEEEIKDGNEN
jgi:hypothetical protein